MEDLTEAERWKFEDDIVERLTMAENMAELEAEIEELGSLVRTRLGTPKRTSPKPSLKNFGRSYPIISLVGTSGC